MFTQASASRVCDQLQIVVALDGDWDMDSGPSFVIPSSSKEARPPQESDWGRITGDAVARTFTDATCLRFIDGPVLSRSLVILVTMPRGSIAAWHGCKSPSKSVIACDY